jgi:hypothetical protein
MLSDVATRDFDIAALVRAASSNEALLAKVVVPLLAIGT